MAEDSEAYQQFQQMFKFILIAGTLLTAIPMVFFLFTDFTEFLKIIANFGILLIIAITAIELLLYEAKGL
jgi:hypothetical protein